MQMKKTGMIIFLVLGLVISLFCGCGKTTSPKTDSGAGAEDLEDVSSLSGGKKSCSAAEIGSVSSGSAAERSDEIRIIGTKAEGENIYQVTLENNTGKNITALTVRASSVDATDGNMMADGDVFENDQKRELYYDASAAKTASQQANAQADPNAKMIMEEYQIILTFEDGTSRTLHAFPFGDIKEGKLLLDEQGTAYLTYLSLQGGQQVSTQEMEISQQALDGSAE